jgi:hypothetical protein
VYLHDIPLPQARDHFEKSLAQSGFWDVFSSESIPLDENAVGRVLSEPICAKISSPHFQYDPPSGGSQFLAAQNHRLVSTTVGIHGG